MKLSERKYFVPVLYISLMSISAIFILIIDNIPYKNWLFSMGWFIIFHFILSIFCLYRVKIKLYSLSGLFISLSYLFHFGQVVIRAFTSSYHFPIVDYAMWLDGDLFSKATVFSLITLSFLILGTILTTYVPLNNINKVNTETTKDYERMGWIILIITLPIKIFIDLNGLLVSFQEGYLAVLDMEFSGVFFQISSFYIIGIVYLLAAFKDSPKKARLLLFVTLGYNVVTMLSGGRSRQMILILVILYFYFAIVEKFKRQYIVFAIVAGFIGIILLNTITMLRAEGIDSISQFLTTMTASDSNPILTAMEEFGSSIYTVYQAMFTVPNLKTYSYGATYIYGIAPIFLNFNGMLTNIVDASIVAKNIYATAPIGGSYIAELYYNFGYFSYVFALLIGFFIQSITEKIDKHVREGNYYQLSFYVMTFYNAIWWVRASFTDFTRAFVWGTIFIWGIHYFVMNYLQNEE